MSDNGGPNVAVVTGAGRGIGAGCAEVFAPAGYAVLIADKDQEGAVKLETALREEGLEALATHCDVTDTENRSDDLVHPGAIWSAGRAA